MIDIDDIIVTKDISILEVLNIIDKSSKQLALVVDQDKKLLGTLSDGDIRRALLNNVSLNDTIENIYFKNPTVAYLNDSKEKIKNLCLMKKIHQIPIVDSRGNLIGLEILDELILQKTKPNRVVLMVGGLGTRLRPLTESIPKPMLEVGGRPILETIILNFKKHGFSNIILSVSYKAEVIESYFGDGSDFGINIEYIYEDKRMGTAGALSLMKDRLSEPFFVMNGDLLTNINFENMMEFHLSYNAMGTMGIREYDFQVPYGVVKVDGIDILKIEEKPIHNFFVSGGIYILNPKILKYIPNDQFYDMPTLFERLIDKNERCISFPIREYWLDIGQLEEYKRANDEYGEVF